MSNLGAALGWKHNNAPGIMTRDGVITAWPGALGNKPDAAGVAAIVAEYQAHLDQTAYVAARKAEYVAQMGQGVPIDSAGYNIDAIWQVLIENELTPAPDANAAHGSAAKLLAQRAAIKAAHPKPE
jgi:hypothetical protein